MDFGALSSKTDLRDYKIVPKHTDLTEFQLDNLPKVKNQSSIKSCVAHSTSSILEWFNTKETGKYTPLSVGFLYGMQGEVSNRMLPGMHIRDACKIIQKYGDCSYNSISFNIEMPECYNRLKPFLDENMYKEAAIHRVSSYAKCSNDESIKSALISGSPVLMAVKWYKKYNFDDGAIYFDTSSDNGLHAIMVYGFNETGWLCQNSYGKFWGNDGRFILPYIYEYTEAWCFVDAENCDVYIPKRTPVLDILYKALNAVINTAARLFI